MTIATIEVLAGDFKKGTNHHLVDKNLIMKRSDKFFRETIPLTQIEECSAASEESIKRLGGTVGWGLAGAALLGPVGLLAGLLVGGQSKDVTFVCKLKDGRKFMGTIPQKAFTKLLAAAFK